MEKHKKVFVVLLGLVFGDEGKGKIADLLAEKFDIIARFQGGCNAGHTLVIDAVKYVLHLIPSGILRKMVNFIARGVVVDPIVLYSEITGLQEAGVPVTERLRIAYSANVTLPTHRLLEAVTEVLRKKPIGSTLKAIGPTYQSFYGREGLLLGDLVKDPNIGALVTETQFEKLRKLVDKAVMAEALELIQKSSENKVSTARAFINLEMEKFNQAVQFLVDNAHMIVADSYAADAFYNEGKSILAEGAQGAELSVGSRNYPFVTCSYVSTASACEQLDIAPTDVSKVIGVMKIYSTKVGGGVFDGQINGDVSRSLIEAGHEFGATTGRERMVGWNVLEQIQGAVRRNGVTEIYITKCDVPFLAKVPEIGIWHSLEGERQLKTFPVKESLNTKAPVGTSRTVSDYFRFIEKYIPGVRVTHITNGPGREEVISTDSPWIEG